MIFVDSKLCKKCGICAEFCPKKVFDRDSAGAPLPTRQDECVHCRLCEKLCPDFAIKVEVEVR